MTNLFPSTVVISLDLELSWGQFDHTPSSELRDRARWTHDIGVPRLLSLLSTNGLSATWAVVGAMMQDRLPHVDQFEEVRYLHFQQPWFSCVPKGAQEADAPEWFGASLIEMIRKALPAQELGFHSFSHVIFGDPGTPTQRARQEFEACRQLAEELEIDGTSFVFPRNSVNHLDLLQASGFRTFRSSDLLPFNLPLPCGRAISGILSDFAALTPCIVKPIINNGLIELPGSLMVRYAGGWRKFIPDACRSRRLEAGLDRVIREGGVFHVWFHPENLYDSRPRLERVIERFFTRVRREVAANRVRCLTMGELAIEAMKEQSVDYMPSGAQQRP